MSPWIVAALCALQAPAEAVEQDPDRPTYSLSDLKLLRETNLFSPKRSSSSSAGRRDERRDERRIESAPARPKPLLVTGFVLDPASQTPRAILEDRNGEATRALKEPLFAKPGDQAGGWTVEAVLADQLTIVQGETKKTLRVGESFPEPASAPASAGASAGPDSASGHAEAAPRSGDAKADDAAKNDVLERLRQKNKKKRADDEP